MHESITSFVGIDVAKHSLDGCILDDGKPFSVSYDAAGLQELLARLPEAGRCLVTVEATGRYQQRVVAQLADAGHYVAVVNPKRVRDFANGLGILAKTDRIDARVIALFGRHVKPRPVAEVHEKQDELQQLVS